LVYCGRNEINRIHLVLDKNRIPSSGIGYATLYIYCKKRGYDTYFQQWTQIINNAWNLGENHVQHFFENADSYLYYRTWQKLNDALHKEIPFTTWILNGCISGTVYLDDHPVENATIQAYLEESFIAETTSLADGTYDIPNLKPDTYRIVFNHPNANSPVTVDGIIVTSLQSTNQDGYLYY
jgi:hypothetical protein